jgi:hypothetical protein
VVWQHASGVLGASTPPGVVLFIAVPPPPGCVFTPCAPKRVRALRATPSPDTIPSALVQGCNMWWYVFVAILLSLTTMVRYARHARVERCAALNAYCMAEGQLRGRGSNPLSPCTTLVTKGALQAVWVAHHRCLCPAQVVAPAVTLTKEFVCAVCGCCLTLPHTLLQQPVLYCPAIETVHHCPFHPCCRWKTARATPRRSACPPYPKLTKLSLTTEEAMPPTASTSPCKRVDAHLQWVSGVCRFRWETQSRRLRRWTGGPAVEGGPLPSRHLPCEQRTTNNSLASCMLHLTHCRLVPITPALDVACSFAPAS